MKKSILFMFSMLLAAGLFAQEVAPAAPEVEAEAPVPEFTSEEASSDWGITVGVSYRNFKDPKLKGAKSAGFVDYVLNDNDGMFYNAGTPSSPNQEALNSAWDASYAGTTGTSKLTFGAFDGVQLNGKGSYGVKDQTAPILGFEKNLWKQDKLDLKLVGNFQFFSMDSGVKESGVASASSKYGYWVTKSTGGINYSTGYKAAATSTVEGSVPVSASTDFDMDLYVFDLGVNLGYDFNNGVRGFVAAGPTLTLADMNSVSRTSVTAGNATLRTSDTDDSTEVNWGIYVSAGASYWFTEDIGLSGEIRFDRGCGDVGTRYFSQDMDTVGGILKLQYCF